MKPAAITLLVVAVLAVTAGSASAQVAGSLGNFDAVNDTGDVAHGFEIRIEDPAYDHSNISAVFGLNNNFSIPAISPERYGAPIITDIPGVGVAVRYAATFDGTNWNVGTPSGPYPNAGDSCWIGGNPAYKGGGLTCDHFGVGFVGTKAPAKITNSWLVDPTNSGVLTPKSAGIPPVTFIDPVLPPPQPGVPPAPQSVIAEIEAEKEANQIFGPAYWVKTFAHHAAHNVNIDDLVKGNPVVPDDTEVESEFEIFQAGNNPANNKKQANLLLQPDDAALVVRYEFYQYLGAFKADGEVLCEGGGKHGVGPVGPANCGGLGDFVGAQMAGFNEVRPPRAVPEPETCAMLVTGLSGLGLMMRGRRG